MIYLPENWIVSSPFFWDMVNGKFEEIQMEYTFDTEIDYHIMIKAIDSIHSTTRILTKGYPKYAKCCFQDNKEIFEDIQETIGKTVKEFKAELKHIYRM